MVVDYAATLDAIIYNTFGELPKGGRCGLYPAWNGQRGNSCTPACMNATGMEVHITGRWLHNSDGKYVASISYLCLRFRSETIQSQFFVRLLDIF